MSNIKLTENETEVLSLGYRFNFPCTSTRISNMKQNVVAETQIPLNKLDIEEKEAFKHETAKLMNEII